MLATLLRPRFWPGHLAVLVSVALATGLGLWQLDAWSQHRSDAARDLEHKPPVPLRTLMSGDSPFPGRSVGQPVTFSGQWLPDTVFVSGRTHAGRTGYWVVSPVLVAGSASAMPVVRGWSAAPQATEASGPVEVTGWLQPTEGSSSDIDDDPHDDVIPSMRIASLVEHVGADLYSGYVVARETSGSGAGASEGLAKADPPSSPGVSTFTGVRNLFYAIEWWVFGGFAVFIWVRWCRDELHPPEPESEDPQALEPRARH